MSSMKTKGFIENLKLLMKEHHLSQSALSKQTDIPQTCISSWLTEKHEPKLEYLWKLADYFDLTLDELVGRSPF